MFDKYKSLLKTIRMANIIFLKANGQGLFLQK